VSWTIEIKPNAEKQYRKCDKKTKKRFRGALSELEQQENPLFQHNVRALTGELRGDYRLRIGDWRILFTPDLERKKLYVYAILPRGNAY